MEARKRQRAVTFVGATVPSSIATAVSGERGRSYAGATWRARPLEGGLRDRDPLQATRARTGAAGKGEAVLVAGPLRAPLRSESISGRSQKQIWLPKLGFAVVVVG